MRKAHKRMVGRQPGAGGPGRARFWGRKRRPRVSRKADRQAGKGVGKDRGLCALR